MGGAASAGTSALKAMLDARVDLAQISDEAIATILNILCWNSRCIEDQGEK